MFCKSNILQHRLDIWYIVVVRLSDFANVSNPDSLWGVALSYVSDESYKFAMAQPLWLVMDTTFVTLPLALGGIAHEKHFAYWRCLLA